LETIVLKIVPETWIIAPVVTREQVERYVKMGWLEEEDLHLDRAFPRDSNGDAFIFRMWFRAPLNKVVKRYSEFDESVLNFRIVDENGWEVDFVKIPEKPLKYRRGIVTNGKHTTEYFEYIDGTFELTMRVKVKSPTTFVKAMSLAGRIGLLSRTKYGYGKFRVKTVQVEG